MYKVHFMDATILCELLGVETNLPRKLCARNDILNELKEIMENKKSNLLLLPLSTIISTGNFISQIEDGEERKGRAEKLSELLMKTCKNDTPWDFFESNADMETIQALALEFPEKSFHFKATTGDLSIVQDYKKYIKETPMPQEHLVRIWSNNRFLAEEVYHSEFHK